MKVYSIGRELGCDIVINDNSDVISRRHATLNVSPSGKMTIVDLSHNGTYVNGIRISQNVPVPVTRKDNVSFAHVARLDWSLIPNTRGMLVRWGVIAVLVLFIIGGCILGVNALGGDDSRDDRSNTAIVDSSVIKQEKKMLEEQERRKQDSIQKHVKDSLKKLRTKSDSIKRRKTPKKDDNTKKAEPKKEEPTTTKRRRG